MFSAVNRIPTNSKPVYANAFIHRREHESAEVSQSVTSHPSLLYIKIGMFTYFNRYDFIRKVFRHKTIIQMKRFICMPV